MWIPRHALPNLLLFVTLALSLLASAVYASDSEEVVLRVMINGQDRGEHILWQRQNDYLFPAELLRSLGFAESTLVTPAEPDGIPLSRLSGVTWALDQMTLTLSVTVPPALLAGKTIDLAPVPLPAPRSGEPSAFLNYRVDYLAHDSFDMSAITGTTEIGIRTADLLLLSDAFYRHSQTDDQMVRLMSSVTMERRQSLQRIVVGDQFASSGEEGGSVNLGGIGFSKVLRMDPYLIRYPVPSLAGQLPLPSDLEVYLDGSRIRSERLPPGPFELKNIAARQGAGLLEIVIRDPFGREQRIGRPYYVSDLLLQQGLSEYSYNVGFQRRSFGEKSFLYGSPVGTLFHRQGINDFLTLGVRGEAGSGIVNGGPLVSFLLGDSGVGTLALASSHDDHLGSGGLASASYSYSGRIISCRVAQRVATSNYGTLDTANGAEVVRAESAAGINLGIGSGASLSLDGTFRRGSSSGESRILALGYGRNLTENTFFNITYRILHNSETIQEIFAGLTWYPGRQTTVAASHEQHGSTTFDQIELQKNAPFGEGFGYRTALSHQEGAGIDDTSLTPSLQYRGQRGIASADLRFDSADRELYEEYRLSLAGAVTYVGGSTHLTRPVSDSFALVRVADAEGVRVLQNNQEVGRTDRHGELVVPSLTSYIDNELAINDQDLPLDYLLDSRHRHLSPSLRSGSCVMFGSGKLRAITGRMVAKSNSLPLEYASLVLTGADATCSTTTGRNGEFYMDSTFCTSSLLKSETEGCHTASSPSPLAAGTHAATLSMGDKVIPLTIVIPATDGPILELGTISCAGPADSPRIGGEGP